LVLLGVRTSDTSIQPFKLKQAVTSAAQLSGSGSPFSGHS